MRVAALYDVHGNLPARECIDRLTALGDNVVFIRGNADRELRGWPAELLEEHELETLREWPTSVELAVEGLGSVLFCHGSPRRDDEILTAITPDEIIGEACADVPFVVGGHTHVQLDRVVGSTRLVNAGSVGCPYEGRRGAFWALLEPDIRLVSTAYDVERAVEAIAATGYDNVGDLSGWLLTPPSGDEATAFFESRRGA